MEPKNSDPRFVQVGEMRDFNQPIKIMRWEKLFVFLFYSEKDEASASLKEMMMEYFKTYNTDAILLLVDVNNSAVSELVTKFQVTSVPTVAWSNWRAEPTGQDASGEPAAIFEELEEQLKKHKAMMETDKVEAFKQIDELLKNNFFVVFIKGTPENPECKFTRELVAILKENNVSYHSVNILADSLLRNWIKAYTGAKTVPQVFLQGKSLGGLDATKEEIKNGLIARLPIECFTVKPQEQLEKLLKEARVMVLIQGTIESSGSEASLSLLKELAAQRVSFNCFDPSKDLVIARALQEKFPSDFSLPALFIDGLLIGQGGALQEIVAKGGVFPKECILASSEESHKE